MTMFATHRGFVSLLVLVVSSWPLLQAQTIPVTKQEVEQQKSSVVDAMFTRCSRPTLYWGPSLCPAGPGETKLLDQCAVVTEYSDAVLTVSVNQLSQATIKNGFDFRGQIFLRYGTARTARLINGSIAGWSPYSDFEHPLLIADLAKKNGRWTNWVGLLPESEGFASPAGSSAFITPPSIVTGAPWAPSSIKQLRERYLSCSGDTLTAIPHATAQSTSPVVSQPLRPQPPSRQRAMDSFAPLDQIPLEKRQFTGSERDFERMLHSFIQYALSQSGLPPYDYSAEEANIISMARRVDGAKMDLGGVRNDVLRSLDLSHVADRDENGRLVNIKIYKRLDPNERPLEVTLGPPPGGWGMGHGFIMEVRFRRLTGDAMFPLSERMLHYGVVHAQFE